MALTVNSVDVQPSVNAKRHATTMYRFRRGSVQPLVLRRGFAFKVDVSLDAVLGKADKIQFALQDQSKARQEKVLTTFKFQDFQDGSGQDWSAKVLRTADRRVGMALNLPPDAWMGKFRLWARGCAGGSDCSGWHKATNDVFVVANPFLPADPAYMEDKAQRDEYVFNEDGMMFTGDYFRVGRRPWAYNQFSSAVLESTALVLGRMRVADTKDAVQVTRYLSSASNSNDGNGILTGKWEGGFAGGTNPSAWTGSEPIFARFLYSGGRPVNYGQCWVFAGILTSMLRSLGIPGRCVTNYASAHHSRPYLDGLKKYYAGFREVNNNGKIWNFHMWNEAWVRRSDCRNCDGWQVVDGTPQEVSSHGDKLTQVGPASLQYVRLRSQNALYDTPFVASEVDGYVLEYQMGPWGQATLRRKKTGQIGKLILTKSVTSSESVDITKTYKPTKRLAASVTDSSSSSSSSRAPRLRLSAVTWPAEPRLGEPVTLEVTASLRDSPPTQAETTTAAPGAVWPADNTPIAVYVHVQLQDYSATACRRTNSSDSSSDPGSSSSSSTAYNDDDLFVVALQHNTTLGRLRRSAETITVPTITATQLLPFVQASEDCHTLVVQLYAEPQLSAAELQALAMAHPDPDPSLHADTHANEDGDGDGAEVALAVWAAWSAREEVHVPLALPELTLTLRGGRSHSTPSPQPSHSHGHSHTAANTHANAVTNATAVAPRPTYAIGEDVVFELHFVNPLPIVLQNVRVAGELTRHADVAFSLARPATPAATSAASESLSRAGLVRGSELTALPPSRVVMSPGLYTTVPAHGNLTLYGRVRLTTPGPARLIVSLSSVPLQLLGEAELVVLAPASAQQASAETLAGAAQSGRHGAWSPLTLVMALNACLLALMVAVVWCMRRRCLRAASHRRPQNPVVLASPAASEQSFDMQELASLTAK